MSLRARLHLRAHHRGPHTRRHIDRQRKVALVMILTGLVRVAIWSIITLAFALRVPLVVGWFSSVAFVSLLSILALVLTDWGQVAASMAQLTAGDAHASSAAAHRAINLDFEQLDLDIARLADLQPGPDAAQLAANIRHRLGTS